jgi:hypothetical protein
MDKKTSDRLAALSNRGTSYEYALSGPGGERFLVVYCRKTRPGVSAALHRVAVGTLTRLELVEAVSGQRGQGWAWTGRTSCAANGWTLAFTGRTQREAISQGELPFVADKVADALAVTVAERRAKPAKPVAPDAGLYTVNLHSHGNPDYAQYAPVSEPRVEVCNSMKECVEACMKYIADNDLGGGNWAKVFITRDGRKLASVSYNGRLWDPEDERVELFPELSPERDALRLAESTGDWSDFTLKRDGQIKEAGR